MQTTARLYTNLRNPVHRARTTCFAAAALRIAVFFLTSIMASVVPSGPAFAAAKPAVWKSTERALLRVDDRAVKVWNVYQEGKKINPLLVQIATRYLFVDAGKHEIFEIDPAAIGHRGSDITWDPADLPAKPLETSDWTVRDVGLAYKTTVRLVAENHVLDLQLSHPLDIRSVR
jgi:hypothetical protein